MLVWLLVIAAVSLVRLTSLVWMSYMITQTVRPSDRGSLHCQGRAPAAISPGPGRQGRPPAARSLRAGTTADQNHVRSLELLLNLVTRIGKAEPSRSPTDRT